MAESDTDLNAAIRAARSIVILETAPAEQPADGAAINSALRRAAGRGPDHDEEDKRNA